MLHGSRIGKASVLGFLLGMGSMAGVLQTAVGAEEPDGAAGVFKRAPAEVAVGGITQAQRAAEAEALGARLAAEMPPGAMLRPIQVDLTDQDRAGLAQPYVSGTPLQIGVTKPLTPAVGFAHGQAADQRGVSVDLGNGGFVWAVTVTSPGAQAIRVKFTNFSLPPSAEAYFFSVGGFADGPYVGKGRNGTGEFWTRSISGDTGVIQVRYTGQGNDAGRGQISFDVAEVAHIGARSDNGPGPFPDPQSHDTWPCADNVACLVDANCVSSTPADPAKDAVAKMEWIIGPSVYTCTGGLLADTVSATQIPYFLTANHCFSASIANLETWFNYRTASCNGVCPHNILTGGAPPSDTVGITVVASNATSDFTLGTLNQAPPAGAVFLGWNNTPVAFTNATQLWRISNANFGPQVYSQQQVDTGSPVCGGLPRGNIIYSDSNTGATMGGSSGSPVVNSASEVVGQLYGCCGFNCADACASAPTNWTVDGAFAVTWPSVQPFLDPSGGCTSNPDCTGGQICCTGTCTTPTCSSAADCNDSNACTVDTCNNPGTCTASCSNPPVACGPNDGCCPAGCSFPTDPNCPSCLPLNSSCTANNQCCSNRCKGPAGNKKCK